MRAAASQGLSSLLGMSFWGSIRWWGTAPLGSCCCCPLLPCSCWWWWGTLAAPSCGEHIALHEVLLLMMLLVMMMICCFSPASWWSWWDDCSSVLLAALLTVVVMVLLKDEHSAHYSEMLNCCRCDLQVCTWWLACWNRCRFLWIVFVCSGLTIARVLLLTLLSV